MNKTKRTRLEARGWRVDSATDFLGLSSEEAALVETRLALSQALRSRRVARGLTQGELARRLKSSQSRVAKMEAGDKFARLVEDLTSPFHATLELWAALPQEGRHHCVAHRDES